MCTDIPQPSVSSVVVRSPDLGHSWDPVESQGEYKVQYGTVPCVLLGAWIYCQRQDRIQILHKDTGIIIMGLEWPVEMQLLCLVLLLHALVATSATSCRSIREAG